MKQVKQSRSSIILQQQSSYRVESGRRPSVGEERK